MHKIGIFLLSMIVEITCPPATQTTPCYGDGVANQNICTNLNSFQHIATDTRVLILEESCHYQPDNWTLFKQHLPNLQLVIFHPPCVDCWLIDHNFPNISLDGRCLQVNPQLYTSSIVVNECCIFDDQISRQARLTDIEIDSKKMTESIEIIHVSGITTIAQKKTKKQTQKNKKTTKKRKREKKPNIEHLFVTRLGVFNVAI